MTPLSPPTVCIIGRKNSGKTELTVGGVTIRDIRVVDGVVYFESGPTD